MAKSKIYVPHDKKLDVWMNPMFFLHPGQAERSWVEICSLPDSMPGKHPGDFDLYLVGEFDDSCGAISSHPPVHFMSALSAKPKPEAQFASPVGR